ncbi:hypothetical protein D3C84_1204560 [compost metagenome]
MGIRLYVAAELDCIADAFAEFDGIGQQILDHLKHPESIDPDKERSGFAAGVCYFFS